MSGNARDESLKERNLPAFPYGAVYYRVSNPPEKDWERDYTQAAADGNNIFRHWFLWSAIERSPGHYTWDAYDRQLDLAADNGIKTIVAEMMTVAPEWTARLHPHARLQTADGSRSHQAMHGSCATGGIDMCLDNRDLRDRGEEFLTRLAERYRDHPGLGGYDIWNECNMGASHCYCDGTLGRFREWLEEKYGSLGALRDAWWRPGLADWEDVTPPRRLLPYNDSLDWLKFRIDNAYELMQWRAEVISRVDPEHRITAHGLGLTLSRLAPAAADDWRAAEIAQSYGVTWGSSRHGDEPWKQPRAMDLIRSASRGKPFWHAEAYGGPLWLQSNVLGRPRDDGRICYPEDIRYWNLTSYMHGATGTLYLRWRPLLDGPLFGAFGPYGMDGTPTSRSEMSTAVGRWAQASEQERLWKSRPVKGEVGILVHPDSQLFTYALTQSTDLYNACYEGAYRGFYDNNIQADFVHIDDIDEWDFLYFPYPVMMTATVADRIARWVENGGTLVAEGCPAYWGDRAHVGETQPNLGLDRLFGATQSYVEFTPDILDDLEVNVLGAPTYGGVFLQAYQPTDGRAAGWYTQPHVVGAIRKLSNFTVAAVTNTYGDGKTLLIGTMPGKGYARHPGARGCAFFERVFEFGRGESPYVRRSDARIRARIHDGEGGTFLWVANHTRTDVPVTLSVSDRWPVSGVRTVRGATAEHRANEISMIAPARDVSVLELEG